jgi:Protein of unknown function (DUF3631)
MTLIPNSTAARKRLSNRRCAQEVLKAHGIPYVPTKTSYTTDCPNCCGGYLNVKIEHDGVAWYCHHCRQGSGEKFERQEAATELGPVKACYDYTDENGNRLFQVLRFEPLYGPKQFRQRTSPDQKKWSIKGVRLVPFKLPALVAAIDRSETVFIVEGEKDVLTLERLGLTATCNPMGAGKWRSDFNPMFRGADVVIIADNDVPGRAHAREVAAGLFDAAAKVRLLDVSELWPEAGASDDISDWLAAGGAADKLKASVEALPNWQSVTPSPLAQILDDVHAFLGRFVIYPSKEAHDAHVLWIAHTHCMDAWESTPRIAFLSPEPASGKTRAIEISELLVPNPVEAVNVSPAYIFRKVGDPENGLPTILHDEIDTLFGPKAKENEDVRGLYNAGHRRGAVTGRCAVYGKKVVPEEISAFSALALAGLGWLPETILSRCVVIRMRRRAPNERVTPFRRRVHANEGHALQNRLAAWAAGAVKEMTEARPSMPDGIEDRNADMWEPLLAIAEAAGEHWPKRAQVAAVTLVTAAADREPSLNIRLLSDLREIFGQAEHLTTLVILERLHGLAESPWNDLKGKQLNDRGLAYRLREFGVKSRTLNLGGESRAKGYAREDLHDAWKRYLTPPPPLPQGSVTSVTSVTEPGFQGSKVTDVTGSQRSVTDDGTEKSADESTGGTDVTDVTHVAGNGRFGTPPPLCDHCGTTGKLQPWSWSGRPDGITLHSSCEAPWFDSEGRRR